MCQTELPAHFVRVFRQLVQIPPKAVFKRFTNGANFINERVRSWFFDLWFHGCSQSDSGVTMLGATTPSLAQISLKCTTLFGFAKCRTFQLNRYSIPKLAHIATWTASPFKGPGITLS